MFQIYKKEMKERRESKLIWLIEQKDITICQKKDLSR